ncbi:MAG: hypothetical protein E7578_03010 [Ruminococcaceae bacterium]|nr:hypothetical protein [Oscillospiraceae bacterium]
MKKTTIFMSLVLCLSFLLASTASTFSVTEHSDPFTGKVYEETDFYDSGVIFVILNHEYSIEWREYTTADFPELELDAVKTHPALWGNKEQILADPEYRNLVYLTLKDKSIEAMVNAIDLLYERNDTDIYYACPVSDTFYTGDEWKPENEPIPELGTAGITDLAGVSVILSNDSSFTGIYADVEQIPAESTVYYKIICEDGYFCNSIKLNSDTVTENSFTMPEGKLEVSLGVYRYGDADRNDTVNISDVSFVLKYLAGYGEIIHKVNGSGCGNTYLDFNNDGTVNLSDCSEMLKYIAKWDGVGPVASEYEDDLIIEHIAPLTEVFGYYSYSAALLSNSDARRIIGKYNISTIDSSYSWELFCKDAFGITDVFHEINENGEFGSAEISASSVMEKFDDEFFENNDIVPLIAPIDQAVSITSIWKNGSKLILDFSVGDDTTPDDLPIYNECSFFFVAVPKNSIADRGLRMDGIDISADAFSDGVL